MPHNTSSTATVNGTQVDVAALEVIDFARLASKEPAEAEKLCKAARSPGFFYVDLKGKSTESYLACVEAMYPMIDKYFEQPHEVKMKDYRESEERGYKPGGFESTLEITRDEVVQGHSALPAILKDDTQVIKQFITVSHHLSQTMLSTLSDELGIPFGESHRDGQPSATCLKLVYEPLIESSDIEENRHTDGGTLTILFGKQWATELQFPGTDKWAFIQPKEGYTLVNVGNSLQKLSGGGLHSCLHRFTQPAPQKRAYVMYFLRPETGKNLYGNC